MNFKEQIKDIQEAKRLYAAEDYAAALPLTRRAVEIAPDDGDLWLAYADSAYETAHYAETCTALEQVMALGCGLHRSLILFFYAAACARMDKPDDALLWYQRAVEAGLLYRSRALRDEAFAALHNDPRLLALCGKLPLGDSDPTSGWRADLAYLVSEFERLHYQGSRLVQDPTFRATVQAIHDAIPNLTPAQIMVKLQGLFALAQDGHTALFPLSSPRLSIKVLNLQWYWFSDGLRVIGGVDSQWLGARLVKVGAVMAEDLLKRLPEIVPHDNPMTIKWIGPYYLRLLPLLQAWGATDSLEAATLTVTSIDGNQGTLTVTGVEVETPIVEVLAPPTGVTPPLFLQHTERNLWMTTLPQTQALYVQYNRVQNSPDTSIADFAARLHDQLNSQPPSAIILDVRLNNGGNNFLNAPLLHTLIGFRQHHPACPLYVIIGRATFSACQNFVNQLTRHLDPILVGEPTGSRPKFVGETTEVILPYSGLRGSISCFLWQDTWAADERMWLAPSLPITYTIADYLGGHDPALAAIESLL